MIFQSEYFKPAVLSLVLHIVIGVLLFASWSQKPLVNPLPQKSIQAVVIEKPRIDKAKLEKARQEALKKKRQDLEKKAEKERQKRKEAQRKKEQEALALKKKIEEQKRKEKELKEKKRREKERQEKERLEKLRKQKEEELRKQELQEEEEMLRLFEEQERLEQQRKADQSVIDKYRLPIQQKIQQFWSRPPSARRGMQVTLNIQLIPGGEVVAVKVVKSSGNAAFDQSAVTAVNRAKTLPTPTDPRVFDRYYRNINLIFSPEDLLK